MSCFRIVFYALSATAMFNYVHFVLVMRLHVWGRVVFGFPFGFAWGWFEIFLYGFFGVVAIKYFLEEVKKTVKAFKGQYDPIHEKGVGKD